MPRFRFNLQRLRALVMVSFGFSRSEARAFLILLPLIFVIVFIQPIYQSLFPFENQNQFADAKQLDSLLATFEWDTTSMQSEKMFTLFHFNPNTVGKTEMDSLGIPEYLSGRIEKYRAKGGTFKLRADLQRIYGLDSALFARLEPYIDLPVRHLPTEKSKDNKSHPTSKAGVASAKPKQSFDLNVADTTVFDEVKGIGPTLARRIIAYRDRLGGFVNEEQLYEVWGLDSTVVKRTMEQADVAADFVPRRININTVAEKELASHPYIRAKIAQLIVTYRFQHGNFSSIEDLGKIYSFEPKTFERIKPYLTLE